MNVRTCVASALAAASFAAFLGAAAATPAQAAETKFSCLPQGADGKPLRQPEIGFICGQVDAQRGDCEAMMNAGNRAGMSLHCFGWTRSDVRQTNKPARNKAEETSR